MRVIIFLIEKVYLLFYPLNKDLKNLVKVNLIKSSNRKNELNKLRVSNISYALWSNTGTLMGLLITYMSLILAAVLIFFDHGEKTFVIKFFILLALILISLILVLLTSPFIIKKVLTNFPPKLYAEISLNNLK